MKVRVAEHQGVSPRTGRTGKQVKGTLSTSVRDHMLDCDHRVTWEDFSIIGQTTTYWKQKKAFSLNETTPP